VRGVKFTCPAPRNCKSNPMEPCCAIDKVTQIPVKPEGGLHAKPKMENGISPANLSAIRQIRQKRESQNLRRVHGQLRLQEQKIRDPDLKHSAARQTPISQKTSGPYSLPTQNHQHRRSHLESRGLSLRNAPEGGHPPMAAFGQETPLRNAPDRKRTTFYLRSPIRQPSGREEKTVQEKNLRSHETRVSLEGHNSHPYFQLGYQAAGVPGD